MLIDYNNILVILKVCIVLFLIISSLINRDVDFIVKNPVLFINETILCNIVKILPLILILVKNKKYNDTSYINLFFIYVFFHVTFQLNGIYTLSYVTPDNNKINNKIINNINNDINKINKNDKNDITKMYTGLYLTSFVLFICAIILITGYLLYTNGKLENFNGPINNFIYDIIYYGLCNSISYYFIYKNRDTNITTNSKYIYEVFIVFIEYVIFYSILKALSLN